MEFAENNGLEYLNQGSGETLDAIKNSARFRKNFKNNF